MNMNQIQSAAAAHGLSILGEFQPTAADQVPAVEGGLAAHLVLVGNGGSKMWEAFRASKEFADGGGDPLNRWSARIGGAIAGEIGARAVFPFGAVRHPFLMWGRRASLQTSALGMLIHPRYGLWHAYRFALIFSRAGGVAGENKTHDICASCDAKPCLRACPVHAFTADGYDVGACCNYLRDAPESKCMREGCIARGACPHAEYVYAPAHAAFHMRAFVKAMDGGEFGGKED